MAGKQTAAAKAAPAPGGGRFALITMLVFDLAAPLAIFYSLRGAGVSQVLSVAVSVVPPVIHTLFTIVRFRRVDTIALLLLTVFAASLVVSFLTGNARYLLAKDAVVTGVAGLWLLATLLIRRPALFSVARPFGEPNDPSGQDWDVKWETNKDFRTTMRVLTSVWGIALLVDAALRLLLAFALPVDMAPLIGNVQYGVLTAVLWAFTAMYSGKRAQRAQRAQDQGAGQGTEPAAASGAAKRG